MYLAVASRSTPSLYNTIGQLKREYGPDVRLRCMLSIDLRANARSKKDFHSTIRAKPIYFGSGILNLSDPRPFPWKDVLHATPMYSGYGIHGVL